eukprot:Gb_06532 [translate_table: standard]
MANEEPKDASVCAHAGSLCNKSEFSGKALWQSSVYEFDSLEDLASATYVYRRYGSPNSDELAKAVALLEAAEQGLATSSGMGAIVAGVLAVGKAGDRIFAQFDCYGITREFFEIDATRFGLRTDFIDVHNVQTLEVALKNYVIPNKTASGLTDTAEPTNGNVIVFLESITNPCIRVADVQAVSDVCKKYGAFLIVDNTFATPVRVKPIKQMGSGCMIVGCCLSPYSDVSRGQAFSMALKKLGADMVIHSVTKFLGGHSDLVAGVVVGTSQHIQAATKLASRWGLTAAPFDSWLASRGIRTLQVRMGRALSTTAELAKRLLCSCIPLSTKWTPDCAIMAIEVPGGLDGAKRAVSCFKLIKLAPSLGGTSTTVSHPASTSHKSLSIAERERMGISDGMLRISVGLEDVEDIWSDIKQGLAAAAAATATATATANKALES